MQITFDREKLLNALTLLKGITRTKSNLPVTRTVRFKLRDMDAVLSANDLEVAATTIVPIQRLTDPTTRRPDDPTTASFLLHAGTLAELLTEIKGQDIVIEIPDTFTLGESKAIIRKGRIEIGLPIMDPDDFPEIELLEGDDAFSIAAGDFIRAVARTLYASSNDETRYVLTGLFMQMKQGTFYMVGTDGFRMAVSTRSVSEGGTSPHLVLPARVAKYMMSAIDEHATIEVTLSEKKAQFVTNAVTIISRVIAEKYPDYESTFSISPDGICFIKRADLLEGLKRMAVLTKKEDILLIRRSRYGIRLDVETQSGYARETIECRWRDDTPLAFNINIKFLLDAIEHLTGDEAAIQYRREYGMIRMDEGESTPPDYTVGIMPIRTIENIKPLTEEDEQQGDAEAACRVHTPDAEGSSPSPATNKTEPVTGSTGEAAKKKYRIKK